MLRRLAPSLGNNLWKMNAIRFLFWMHFFVSVLVPFFRDWGGITYTQIFTLNAWFMFWSFLLEIPTGTVADVFGRRTSLALGAAIAAVAAVVYVSTPRFGVFLCGEVLFAIAFTLMSGADEALVYDTLEQLGRSRESKRTLARLESFKLAGIVTGALTGGLIAATLGLTGPMRLQPIPAVLAAALALTLHEPAGATAVANPASYLRALRSGVRYFGNHPVLRVLAFDMIGTATLAWLIIWMYQPQLERVGVGLAWFGVMHAAMCGGQIAVLSGIERLEGMVGSRRGYLFLSALLPGVAFLLLAWTDQRLLVLLAILVAAAFGLSRPPLFASYMNKHIASEQRATVLSTVSMLRTLGVAVINPLAGYLVDWSMRGALAVFGVTAIAVALLTRVEEEHLID